jgi:hypothetical protein
VRAFKCAWFDERDYFEFFPLPAIYPRYGNDSPLCPAAHNDDYVRFRIMRSQGGERMCEVVFIVLCCA